jgi:multidrug efflux pump subunit AcrB
VATDVKKALAEVEATLPEGMQVSMLFDSTKFIEQSVNHIYIELLLSVALTRSSAGCSSGRSRAR